jgi:methionine sulfoxide reductase heme-binding subunit
MTRNLLKNNARSLFFILALLPLTRLVWLAFTDGLGSNPVEFVIRSLGTWTLVLLLVTLSVTPLRLLFGIKWMMPLRRMMGLFTFFYVCLHLLAYAGLDQWFDWQAIVHDIAKHPYVLVGFTAFVLMIPLAATSTQAMMRRLGRRWQKLHRLVYVIAILGVTHYWWLVKKDVTEPFIYALVLFILLAVRVYYKRPMVLRTQIDGSSLNRPEHGPVQSVP